MDNFKHISGDIKAMDTSKHKNIGIDFNQFQMWAKNFQKKHEREAEHAEMFKKIDTDHSGKLSLSEAKAAVM